MHLVCSFGCMLREREGGIKSVFEKCSLYLNHRGLVRLN